MRMEFRTEPAAKKTKKRTKPVDHFRVCPNCGCNDLIHVNPDVLCSACDWDSMAWDVSRGAMDDLERVSREFFGLTPKLVASQSHNELLAPTNQMIEISSDESKKGA